MANDAHDALFDYWGQKFNVDPAISKTLFHLESSGGINTGASLPNDPDSPIGPLQMRPSTAAAMAKITGTNPNPRKIEDAIPLATAYVAQGLNATQSPSGAMAYYHGGPDQSGWGPKTQAYVAKGARLYPTMQVSAQAQPSAPTGEPPVATSPAKISGADIRKQFGETDVSAKDVPAQTGADIRAMFETGMPEKPTEQWPAYMGGAGPSQPANLINMGGAPGVAATPTDTNAPAEAQIRAALAPAPGTSYGAVLPFARNDATGAIRPALPSSLRDLATGTFDLTQGPSTGTVSPEGTMALLNAATGGAIGSSVARGSAPSIAGRLLPAESPALGRNEVPDLLGQQFRSAPQLGSQPNQLALAAPPAPISSPIPNAPPQSSNLLAFPSSPAASAIKPAGTSAATAPVAAMLPEEAATLSGNAFSPGSPPRSTLPIVTQGQASAQVDRILEHFGKGGETNPTSSPLSGANSGTLAQSTGNAGYAALENGLRNTDPHFNNLYNGMKTTRDAGYGKTVRSVTGSGADIEAGELSRTQTTSAARESSFANKIEADASPVEQHIQDILSGPDGKRDAVVNSLKPLLEKLKQKGGNGAPETDPEMLYGVRKAINDMLDATGTQEGSDAATATRQLISTRNVLDKAIDKAAPGFLDYIGKYSELSKPIDAMKWLQKQNITDQMGNIQLGKLDNTIKRLENARNAPGNSMADSVTNEQEQTLRTLRDAMRRDSAVFKTMPVGSPTVQNLATNSTLSAMQGAGAVLTGLGAITLHPAGFATAAATMGTKALASRGNALVQTELRNRLLYPNIAP